MNYLPTIIIPVFNRIEALKKLIRSLLSAHYPEVVGLHFVADRNASDDVLSFIHSFDWPHGEKIITHHNHQKGLDENIRFCGSLSAEYGSIIILEDDSLVSPFFYDYARQSLIYYGETPEIAGVSLYRYNQRPVTGFHHDIINNDKSVYFLQKTGTRGQAFTAKQWQDFEQWLSTRQIYTKPLPAYMQKYGADNWELQHNLYLHETDKYFVSPKLSVASNQGVVGFHHNNQYDANRFKVPLQHIHTAYHFVPFIDALNVYDAYFELIPSRLLKHCTENNPLQNFRFDCDLHGEKAFEHLNEPYTLTCLPINKVEISFADDYVPLEQNLILNVEGEEIKLVATELLEDAKRKQAKFQAKKYFGHVPDIGLKQFLIYKLLKYVDRKKG